MLQTIEKHQLVRPGDRVLVALSGGPDSVALLHALTRLRESLSLEIFAVHLNHRIRGADADADEAYVLKLCQEMGVPLHTYKEDIPGLSKRLRITEEEAGRKVRYEIFEQLSRDLGCQRVAVAQHRDDQVETFLMRIIRGSGLDGLGAIAYMREGKYIRPLLDVTKEEILGYLRENHLESRTDHTNFETHYLRNKIRLELIPELKKGYNPNITATISRNIDIIQEELSYIREEGLRLYGIFKTRDYEVAFFQDLHPGLKGRVLRNLMADVKGDIKNVSGGEISQLRELLEQGVPGKYRTIQGFHFEIGQGRLLVDREAGPVSLTDFSHELGEGTHRIETPWGDRYQVVIKVTGPRERVKGSPGQIYVDADKIKGPIVVRNRRQSDRLRPIGMGGKSKKLKDFMIDEKIPRENRDKILIFENSKEIIWVYGYRLSEVFKVEETTLKILKIEVIKL